MLESPAGAPRPFRAPRRPRRLRRAVIAVGVVLALGAPMAPAAHATGATAPHVVEQAAAVAYVKKPFSPTIYAVTATSHRAIGYAEWRDAGSPTPGPSPTAYFRYAWSSTLYGVTSWPDGAEWERLSYAGWVDAGRPAAQLAGWIPGSSVYRWETSDELFLRGEDASIHKLTWSEWSLAGRPPATVRANEGFVRLSWDGSVARVRDLRYGQGAPISYSTWLAEGAPTPRVAPRFPGDIFEKDFTGPGIRYSGPTVSRYVSFAEWQAAGSPVPYAGRNGRLDPSTLCGIAWSPGVLLRCDAARALERLNVAYTRQFGRPLAVDYGYRTYATQVYLRMTLGTVAAVPGTSNHGWGLAIDTPEGAGHGFGSPSYAWLRANAPTYGWVAPRWAWADGSNPEYWHFEYTG
ncbi:M15 family metallopeptidase [Cellulosimicrobium funkei]|uniref:M15 family metallopeptidase n=1 Tax=Cellulosimicrobium funkei TaxID=264251 RepID=UPI0036BCEE74